jgi:phosphate transport system substrate-binding protein
MVPAPSIRSRPRPPSSSTWATALTVNELRAIWQPRGKGAATRWAQVRPGFPDRELHLFSPGAHSGTFDFFTEVIVGRPRESRTDFTASEDDTVIVDGVAGDPLALGYVGFDHFQKHRDRLRGVAVDDLDDTLGVGPVEPSALNVRRGVYRPLSRPLFIYVRVASLERDEVEKFVARYLRPADGFAAAAGAIPLRDAECQLVRSRLQRQETGSGFTGRSAAGANVGKVPGE